MTYGKHQLEADYIWVNNVNADAKNWESMDGMKQAETWKTNH